MVNVVYMSLLLNAVVLLFIFTVYLLFTTSSRFSVKFGGKRVPVSCWEFSQVSGIPLYVSFPSTMIAAVSFQFWFAGTDGR